MNNFNKKLIFHSDTEIIVAGGDSKSGNKRLEKIDISSGKIFEDDKHCTKLGYRM
jgi:hypothetical protein